MPEHVLPPASNWDVEEQAAKLTAPSADEFGTVILHNDDVTPYDYVIYMLGSLFLLSEEIADHIAWTAHTKGAAVVVVRPRSEAEKLVKVARGRAKTAGYPLTFTLEQE